MLLALFLLQAGAAAAPPADIELNIRARVRSVEIERKGEARLEVRAEPDAGSRVEARAEPRAEGGTSLRDVRIDLAAEARIGDPGEIRGEAETAPQQ
jgi:hypothetical protein